VQLNKLIKQSQQWKLRMRKKQGASSPYRPWWHFVFDFDQRLHGYLNTFMAGVHKLSPLRGPSGMWCPLDRLITHLIHLKLRPMCELVIDLSCDWTPPPSPDFELPNDRTQIQSYPKTQVKVHSRTCEWALTRIRHRTYNTGRREPCPVTDQRYLSRWAAWWRFDAFTLGDNLLEWIRFTDHQAPHLSWLGEELLLR
jgi:hypothetical protein